MIKRLFAFILSISTLFSISVICLTHGKDEHDSIIENILFGNPNYCKFLQTDSTPYKSLEDLENAVALCVDQYGGSYSDLLSKLKAHKIHGLPESIDAIDFTSNQHHRRYTHRGWNFNYSTNDLGHWNIRKNILLQTVNHVFSFQKYAGTWGILGINRDFDFTEQCKAFSAFLYYLHIIGDLEDSKTKNVVIGDIIPLVREHPGEGNEDIFWELKRILPIVLKDSSKINSRLYNSLILDLDSLSNEAKELEKAGGMNDENFKYYHDVVERLINKLVTKIPILLKDEPFFKKVFY